MVMAASMQENPTAGGPVRGGAITHYFKIVA